MADTIRTKTELIEAMKGITTSRVVWLMGRKPSAPGAYSLIVGASSVRVHASAVAGCIKLGALLQVRRDFAVHAYRLRAGA